MQSTYLECCDLTVAGLCGIACAPSLAILELPTSIQQKKHRFRKEKKDYYRSSAGSEPDPVEVNQSTLIHWPNFLQTDLLLLHRQLHSVDTSQLPNHHKRDRENCFLYSIIFPMPIASKISARGGGGGVINPPQPDSPHILFRQPQCPRYYKQ